MVSYYPEVTIQQLRKVLDTIRMGSGEGENAKRG